MSELKGSLAQAGSGTIAPLQRNVSVAPVQARVVLEESRKTVEPVSPPQNVLEDGPGWSCITASAPD